MWTASIINKELVNGSLKATVSYTNGTTTLTEVYYATADTIPPTIQSRLNSLSVVDNLVTNTTVGPFTPPTPPTPTPPTPAVLAQQAFMADLGQFRQMNTAISLGLKTNTDSDYTTLQAKLKAEYLPAYLNLL